MIKEMNKYIFARHLELVINEIKQKRIYSLIMKCFRLCQLLKKENY